MLHRCVYHDRMPTRQQNMSVAAAVEKASPLPIACWTIRHDCS